MFRFRRLSFWWLYNVCSPLLEEATFRGQILEEEGLEARFLCWWGQILRGILEESSGIGRDVLERRFPSKYSCGFISDYCWIFIISIDNNLLTESFKYYDMNHRHDHQACWNQQATKQASLCVSTIKYLTLKTRQAAAVARVASRVAVHNIS